MGALKGNKNGAATQFKPLSQEETVMMGTRLPRSEAEQISQAIAMSGQTKAEWLREAIAQKLEQHRV
jgi:Ribbon-helix-helix protein, copG family